MAKARAVAQANDPSKMIALAGLGFTFLLNAATAGYVYGGVSFRVQAAEERTAKLEKKIDDFAQVGTDMAVMKNQLQSIAATLARLETQISSAQHPGK